MQAKQSSSSQIMDSLYPNLKELRESINKHIPSLIKSYPDPAFAKIFQSIPDKSITLIPMALFKYTLEDLGKTVDPDIVAGIGLCCLQISTHDDVIDNNLTAREVVSAHIYTGNIAQLYGLELIAQQSPQLIAPLSEMIKLNHYRQHIVVKTLWKKKPLSFKEYLNGINHIQSFCAIGLLSALVYCQKPGLKAKLWKFAYHYGNVLQLIDDIREVAEDARNGYNSYPLIEGAPYKESFSELESNLEEAKRLCNHNWKSLQSHLNLLTDYIKNLKASFIDYPKISVVSVVIKDQDNKILFLKRSPKNKTFKNYWQLPEGKVNAGERSLTALKREVKEEISGTISGTKRIGTFIDFYQINKQRFQIERTVYRATYQGKIRISNDHIEHGYFTSDQVKKLLLIDGLERILTLIWK